MATGLRQRGVPTRSALGEGIIASYRAGHDNLHVRIDHLLGLANIRDLLLGCMYPIPFVTKPQAFKISKDPSDNGIKMQVQHRSYNDDWGVIDR